MTEMHWEPQNDLDDTGSAPSEPMPRRQPPRLAEGAHAGSSGGLDSISTVFDDRTARGVDSHAIRGVKEEIRSRLAPGDFAGTEDPADEAAVEPGQPQGVANPLVATARRDAGRGGDSVERLENPRHRLELGFESRPI